MTEYISPEEKLLRLIRGQKSNKPQVISQPQKNTLSAIKSANDFLSKFFFKINLQNAIIIVALLAGAYLLISLIYPFFGLNKIKVPKSGEQNFKPQAPAVIPQEKPFDYYQQKLGNKQIFGQAQGQAGSGGALPVSGAAAELIKDIALVGIIAGANPQAIIEDRKTQKTYYVVKGQMVGEFQVEDILEGKIILNYRGQRYELGI